MTHLALCKASFCDDPLLYTIESATNRRPTRQLRGGLSYRYLILSVRTGARPPERFLFRDHCTVMQTVVARHVSLKLEAPDFRETRRPRSKAAKTSIRFRALSNRRSRVVCSAMVAVPLSAAASAISTNLGAFAPSFLGGLSIGLLAVSQLVISGRILGISGAVRGIVKAPLTFDRNQVFRYMFVAGLVAGGALIPCLGAASSTVALPGPRVAAAGLLVGVGTSLSNGCTSGHGICGISRLSMRSILSTCIFMLFGALAVSMLQGTQATGMPAGFIVPAVDEALTKLAAGIMLSNVAFTGSLMVAMTRMVDRTSSAMLENIANFGTGLLFALSLAVSGMLDSAKVIGFLSIFSGSWDASLAFVMGGALLVAFTGYQAVLSEKFGMKAPLACDEFNLPTSKEITSRLVIGSAIFGVGWGLAGVCPGPALANLNALFVAFMAAGMLATTSLKWAF